MGPARTDRCRCGFSECRQNDPNDGGLGFATSPEKGADPEDGPKSWEEVYIQKSCNKPTLCNRLIAQQSDAMQSLRCNAPTQRDIRSSLFSVHCLIAHDKSNWVRQLDVMLLEADPP